LSCHPTHAIKADCFKTFKAFYDKNGTKMLCPICRKEIDPRMCQEVADFDPRKSTIKIVIDKDQLQKEIAKQVEMAKLEAGLPDSNSDSYPGRDNRILGEPQDQVRARQVQFSNAPQGEIVNPQDRSMRQNAPQGEAINEEP
jgi:hypothetical protein